MKALLVVGSTIGVGAILYLGYRLVVKPQSGAYVVDPSTGKLVVASQYSYPYTTPAVPVAQTSNQSQYTGDRVSMAIQQTGAAAAAKNAANSMPKNAADLALAASVTKSISSIWDDLGVSSWFSSSDPAPIAGIADFGDAVGDSSWAGDFSNYV